MRNTEQLLALAVETERHRSSLSAGRQEEYSKGRVILMDELRMHAVQTAAPPANVAELGRW